MTKNRIRLAGLALLVVLAFVGRAETSDDIFSRLINNRGKSASFTHIAEHGGQVYASGFMSIPGWNPVHGVDTYNGGFAIVGDVIIYQRPQGTDPFPTELYRSDLRGGNETVIAGDVLSYGGVWAAGNRIIFASITETPDYDIESNGVYWYDVKTSQTTRLLPDLHDAFSFSFVSFDEDFVYFKISPAMEIWRVSWDGSHAEILNGVLFPDDFYKVEGKYYYCESIDYDADATEISRYSVKDGKKAGSYTVDATGLIAIKDGWAYFGNETGIYKINTNTGETFKLADLAPNVYGWSFGGFEENSVIGGNLYFSACFADVDFEKEGVHTNGLFKVQLNGGRMEYQNVGWFES